MVASTRKRYRGGYVEDPNLGHKVDVSNMGEDILSDPLKLLDWLSSDESNSGSADTESGPRSGSCNNSNDELPAHSAFEVRRNFYDADEDAQRPMKSEEAASSSAHAIDRGINAGSVKWELSYLNSRDIEYIDNREKGGSLWVIGDYSIGVEIGYLRSCGMGFHFKREGGSATNRRPAWWTKSETPAMPSDLTEIETFHQKSTGASSADVCSAQITKEQEVDRLFTPSELVPLAAPELLGILIGITCDGKINELEAKTLLSWLESVDEKKYGNLSKIKKLLERYLADDVIDEEEEKALLSLFRKIMDLAEKLDGNADPKDEHANESPSSACGERRLTGKTGHEVEIIRNLGCRCVDLRDEGGALWILGGSWVQDRIETLRQMGLRFSFSAKGSVATGFAPGWWTRDRAIEINPSYPGIEKQRQAITAELAVEVVNGEEHERLGSMAGGYDDSTGSRETPSSIEVDSVNARTERSETCDSASLARQNTRPKSANRFRNIRLTVTDRFSKTHTVLSSNVLFMKANGPYTTIFTCDSQVIDARCGLHSMEMQLRGEGFIRPNRSYLISINQVKSIEEQDNNRFYIFMKGRDESIPVHLSRMNMINRYFDPETFVYR